MALGVFLNLGHYAGYRHLHANLFQKEEVVVNKGILSDTPI
jgi:hypothetical protein